MPIVQNILRRTGLLAAMLFLASLLSGVATLYAETGSTPERHSDTFVTGRVLSATDGQPMANVRLTLGDHTTTTDARGIFVFTQVVSGYQLVKVDQPSLEPYRRAKPGKPAPSHLHVDPVLVNVMSDQATELPYPIYVVEPHPAVHSLTAGRKAEIRPAHLSQFRLMIPEGTTIKSEDGQTHTGVSITPLRPDRVPKLPDTAAPRTVYLVSFDKGEGGVPTTPVPVTLPNDLGGDPGARVELWYYDKSPAPDPASHRWKMFGLGTVSPDGKQIIPDPGVGQPQFCYLYPTLVASLDVVNTAAPGGQQGGDPVDLSSGVFVLTKTDLVLPGVLPVAITRTYRTRASGIGAFGQGGSFNYDLSLTVVGAALRLQMPDSSRYLFSQEGDGKYRNTEHPLFKGAAITKFGDGSAELRWKDGMIYAFNPAGWLIRQQDRYNNQITITRNASNLVTQITNPAGQALTFTYVTVRRGHDFFPVIASITDPMGRVVRYGYNAFHNGRLAAVTDPTGAVTRYTYGDLSPPPFYWNEGLQTITDARGITYLKNEYDLSGRVFKQTLADGSSYSFAYTTAGSTITQTAVTDPRGNVTTYTFNAAQYVATANASGQLTTYNREPATNNLLTVTDALSRVTTYSYDANGNVASILDPENNLTQFQYESTFSRLTQITDALTPANVTTFAYNDVARTTTITNPLSKQTVVQYNTAGQPTSITDPLLHATSFTYDSAGNLATTTDALSSVTTRQYDAVSRLTTLIDPRGKVTRFAYDAVNRVTQIQDAIGGFTAFTYDLNGNLLTVNDAKNQTTTYTYDPMDRLATRKDGLNRQESYQYDKAGNLSQFTDRKSQVTTFGYDAVNRRTTATYVGSSTTFGYDAIGRLTSVNDSLGGNITWVYDTVSGGHHPRVAETSSTGTVTIEYDEIGRRFKLSATGQGDTTYGYDAASQFKTVTKGAQTVTLNYDNAGRRTSLVYPNTTSVTYGYDNANKLLTVTHTKAPSTNLDTITYTYDPAGNRRSQVRSATTASIIPTAVTAANIAYDVANELTRWNSASTNVTYDLNGNIQTEISGGVTTTYTWDSRNRLTGISRTGLTASFVYDGLGRRKSKTINGTTTGFWYDGNDLYAELSGVTPTFAYVRGLSIDEPYIRKGVSDEFYHADGLGTALNLSNASGAKTRTYTYEPFGTTVGSGTASTNTFQYTGRENDGTNLYYYRARYYHPKFQRFMGEDPTGLGGGDINLYTYVRNNPLRFVDPRGLTWETNSEFFLDWVFGGGAAFRFYNPNSIQTTELRNSEGAEIMRDLFKQNGCSDTLKIHYGTYRAYWDTAANPLTADLSSTAFQVGGFAGASVVNNGNGTATFNLRNVAGAHSLFLHAIPNMPWDNGPMRNITQSFSWTEPLPCLGHRK